MRLDGKTITVGVTGGIAVYKTCELVSRLRKAGANVFVVMTKNATEFVNPLTFETLSDNRVVTDTFARDFEWEVEHVSLAKKSDIFVVAPCTANFLAKYNAGIADDFLSTTALAMKCPVLLAPAMNTAMMENSSTQRNLSELEKKGVYTIYGGSGFLACGDVGKGRMAEPADIYAAVENLLFPKRDLEGKTVLVTSGGTREPIDPVRYIGNNSSGKMGAAICDCAVKRGAKVILIAGCVGVLPREKVTLINVSTTAQMYDAVMANLSEADIIVKAAAPADYRPEKQAENKIKDAAVSLQLVKNPDIAAAVGKVKGNKILVAFCAETQNLIESAKRKLVSKNADLVVANDVSVKGAGFNTDTNIASFVTEKEVVDLPMMSKSELAERIFDKISETYYDSRSHS